MAKIGNISIKINSKALGWAIKAVAKKIGNEIGEAYETAVTNFYGSYSPVRYNRTRSLYNGAYGVGGRKVYSLQTGKYSYECGLEVGGEFYDGNPYVKNPHHGAYMDPWNIFLNSYFKGIHGFSAYGLGKYKTNTTKNKWWKTTPPRTTPIAKMMNDKYKTIDNAGHIFGLLEAELNGVDLIE